MTTLCPVCSKFESSDVVALERHIDECLSKGDEEFARSLADSESKQLAEKSKAELAASKSTKSSSNDDNNNNTANAGVSLASSATHSGPLTRSQRKKARDSFDSSSDLLLSAKKPATDSMQLDDNGNNHRNANNSKTTVADDDDDDDDFEIIQKPTSAPTNSNNSHSSATTSSAVGGARTPLKRSMQNDDDDGSDNELAEARAAQLAAERRREQERADAEMVRRMLEDEQNSASRAVVDDGASMTCVVCKAPMGSDSIMLDKCMHVFCKNCLATPVVAACKRWRSSDDPPGCPQCKQALTTAELRTLVPAEDYSSFESRVARSALTDSAYVTCVNDKCGNVMERVPVSQKDARGVSKIELHKLEYRLRCRECQCEFCASCRATPYHAGHTCDSFLQFSKARHCRFCDSALEAKLPPASTELALRDVCNDERCTAAAKAICLKSLPCGHMCCGVRDEARCLRCLHCDGKTKADDAAAADDDNDHKHVLTAAPVLQLGCGHLFHAACVRTKLQQRWPSPCISFQFADCPLCKVPIVHEWLNDVLKPLKTLEKLVTKQAKQRMAIEHMQQHCDDAIKAGKYKTPAQFAMSKLAYYMCSKCNKPYFGGLKECAGGANAEGLREFNPKDLVCGGCSGATEKCARHGVDFIEWKCRFCCKLATFFCGGKCHFCNDCHAKPGTFVEFSKWETKPGPGACPLGGTHLANGCESALGCAMCRADVVAGKSDKKKDEKADDDSDDSDSDADDDDVDDDGNSKAKSSSSAKAPESRVKRQKKLAAAPNPAGNGGIVGSVIDAFARRLRK